MKMENDFLERRREINRRAARKSRSRQKEMAVTIRKKYYEAQSAHTKLVYERNQLERERNHLKTLLETHRCSIAEGHEGGDPLPRRSSLNRSQSVFVEEEEEEEEYTASSHLGRSVSCPVPSRCLDDDDDDDDDDGVEEMSVSSEDGRSSSSSASKSSVVGENTSSISQLDMASNFNELGINGELFVSSSDEGFLGMSGLPLQNPEDGGGGGGSGFLLDRCEDEWSDILDCFMHPIASPLPPVIESDAAAAAAAAAAAGVATTESGVSVLRSLDDDDETDDSKSSQASKNSELRLETTGDLHQLEALDLSKRGPLSDVRRVSSIECSKSMPTTPIVVDKKPNFLARTFSKEPARDNQSTSIREKLLTEKPKDDKQDFRGNIPLLVESFIVGEKY